MKKIFETRILAVGPLAQKFICDSQMMILFGEEMPAALADYCYKIKISPIQGDITAGSTFLIDEQKFLITAVGHVVKQNLQNLGHITIAFDGKAKAKLPGILHVEAQKEIDVTSESVLQIICDEQAI